LSSAWPRRVAVDFDAGQVTIEDSAAGERTLPLASAEAFAAVSAAYLRCGWDAKYVYSFSWLGRPIIQLPDDAFRMQELLFALQPDVIVETGVAHGGSLVFYASLCKLAGKGRVIGVEVELRAHNRAAIDAHPLRPLISLVDGSSVDPATLAKVKAAIKPGEKVIVLLDSKHTREHVAAELEAYAPLVSVGSYLVAMDGIMQHLVGAPRSQPGWAADNPAQAARECAARRRDFRLVEPVPPFNEGAVKTRVSYCPDAFLQRVA
jgi:cephalosporin hydroxylase